MKGSILRRITNEVEKGISLGLPSCLRLHLLIQLCAWLNNGQFLRNYIDTSALKNADGMNTSCLTSTNVETGTRSSLAQLCNCNLIQAPKFDKDQCVRLLYALLTEEKNAFICKS